MKQLLLQPIVIASAAFVLVGLASLGAISALGKRRLRLKHLLIAAMIGLLVAGNELVGLNSPPRSPGTSQLQLFNLAGIFVITSLAFMGIIAFFRKTANPAVFMPGAVSVGAILTVRHAGVWEYFEFKSPFWAAVVAVLVSVFWAGIILLWARKRQQ